MPEVLGHEIDERSRLGRGDAGGHEDVDREAGRRPLFEDRDEASGCRGTLRVVSGQELGPRGITVNSVAPGATRTEGLIMPEDAIAQLVAQTPLGRLGEPRDIADVVGFLVGEEGRWLTGQNLHATGGII